MTPDQYTISEHYLEVGDGHTIYVQEWGNPKAKSPIFFLHGGPGSQSKDRHKTQFDPRIHRVIFHDQRGCGKSLPYGSLEHNTTQHLVADIELIAKKFDIASFVLVGGSWGACLALAFALAHPKRVTAMVLSGIFTGSRAEIDWLDQGKFQSFFPEVWGTYLEATPKAHHKDPSAYHFAKALGSDEEAAKKSAYAYNNLEGSVIQLDDRFYPQVFEDFDPASSRIEIFYLKNNCFMPDRHILKNASALTMPIRLVQGRYDMVCPPQTAYELQKTAPDCEVFWTLGGHKSEHENWNITRSLLDQFCK